MESLRSPHSWALDEIMEFKKIENIRYFNIAAILLLISLTLQLLPEQYKIELMRFGVSWGSWWLTLVDSSHLFFLFGGIAAMCKAINYNKPFW